MINWVYMLECENGAYYTGFAINLAQRYYRHKNGLSKAKYVAAFKARSLACCWRVEGTKGDALKIEACIKKMNHASKQKIAKTPQLLESIISERYGIAIVSYDTALVEADAASYGTAVSKKIGMPA